MVRLPAWCLPGRPRLYGPRRGFGTASCDLLTIPIKSACAGSVATARSNGRDDRSSSARRRAARQSGCTKSTTTAGWSGTARSCSTLLRGETAGEELEKNLIAAKLGKLRNGKNCYPCHWPRKGIRGHQISTQRAISKRRRSMQRSNFWATASISASAGDRVARNSVVHPAVTVAANSRTKSGLGMLFPFARCSGQTAMAQRQD